MTESAAMTPTCQGLPLAERRPLTAEERGAVEGWLAQRRREGRWWIGAWIIVALLPCSPLAALATTILWDADHVLTKLSLLAWVAAIVAAVVGGLLMELLRPTRPWIRWGLFAALVSGALGMAALTSGHTWGDTFLFPVFFAVLGTLALFLVRTFDRSKLVRVSHVQKDLTRNEVWSFAAEGSTVLVLLPGSGLLVRAGEKAFPARKPIRIQMAAPLPEHRWELPARGLESTEGNTRLLYRPLEPAERLELAALAKAHLRQGLPNIVAIGSLGGIGMAWLAWRVSADGVGAIAIQEWLVAGSFGVLSIWIAPGFLRLRRGIRADQADGRVVVVRQGDAGDEAPPTAEVLPHSKILWSEGGRLGPFRLKYLKQERIKG